MGAPEKTIDPVWSFTRARMLQSCPRRYFYHYHLSSGGIHKRLSATARHAYVLKHLTDLDLVLGLAIHRAAGALATSARMRRPLPTREDLWATVRSALNAAWSSSRRMTAFMMHPNRCVMLREVFYERGLPPATIERVRDKAMLCLESLSAAPLWATLRRCPPDHIRVVDKPILFHVEHAAVWAAPDLAYRPPGSGWVVVDWKTGKKNPTEEQKRRVGQL